MAHCQKPYSNGYLATCTAFTANDDCIIAAFAHVPAEDGEQWSWFLQHVKESFPLLCQSQELTILSDQDKVRVVL